MKFIIIEHIGKPVLLKIIIPFTFIIPVIVLYIYTGCYENGTDSFLYQITSILISFVCFLTAVYALFFLNSYTEIDNMSLNKNLIK